MSSTLLNSTIILNDILSLLRTKTMSLDAVSTQYDKRFANNADLKPGTTLYVRKPIQVTIRTGKKRQSQDTVEEKIPVTCTEQMGVDLPAFTSEQLTMNIKDFRKRYLEPSASRIAAELDKLIFQHAAEAFHMNVGTCGTTPATATVLLQAGQKFDEQNADDERYAFITPGANTALVNAVSGLYSPDQGTAGKQWRTGNMMSSLGLKIGRSNNLHRITMGSRDAAGAIDDAGGTTLIEGMESVPMDNFGGASETIKKGEKFTIAAVYDVTPETKINTGSLKQFTVTADATASSGDITVYFSPALYSTGARKNCTALPANDAVVTAAGTAASTAYPHNIVMAKDALALVTADLPLPKGTHDAHRSSLDGISMRYITDYDATNDEFFTRIDIFYGISTLYTSKGVVLFG